MLLINIILYLFRVKFHSLVYTMYKKLFTFTPIEKDTEARVSPPPIKPIFNRSVSSQSLKRALEGEENNTNFKKQKTF